MRGIFEPWIDTDFTLAFPEQKNGECISQYGRFCGLDVIEKEKELVVVADLPGLKKEDVSVTIRENTLLIEAERKQEKKGEKDKAKWEERYHGTIKRSVKLLPTCDTKKITTKFENGVLTLVFAKKPEDESIQKITL
ncbi:MAG: HSP20 family protein [Amphiamblys sp. WSBS2006]|nr:MAG: HSP20 family protein [Amphiamblys sp. WSBS2006]